MKKLPNSFQTILNFLLFSAGIFLFAWFIHSKDWTRFVAFGAMILPCVALYRQILPEVGSYKFFSIKSNRKLFSITLAGLIIGTCAGMYYRRHIGAGAIPLSPGLFAPVAVLIGLSEELVFRGAAFFIVKKWPFYLSIPITAILHASYKTLLFLQPEILQPVDTWFLFYTTFLAGLIIGYLRYASSSVIPAIAAHGAWDLVVYGDSPAAPWWVW